MCPLRIILIFLSATLAGFFVLRNLKSQPESQSPANDETHHDLDESDKTQFSNSSTSSANRFSKVCSAMESGFWTCVDMASGRYLWRHLSKRSE
ncbi:Methyltransferase-related protein [Trema orientale]|uniref:Methyltransferase-related protein n=2 Tax=Cannabaceae TaxID=3481 RepID=A0A2P5AZA0_PARAD|nr:Methyltransferase-related protein [Parasponia andersonii]PON66178.1 Methyltransferase-related protein [Trema orientale]